MERIVKGIWIPLEIWQNTDLNWNEKILLMEIDSFTSAGKDCYISNEYIAELLGGISIRSASRYLSNLIDAGYVKVVRTDGRKRYIESAICVQAEWTKLSMQGGQNCLHTDINYLNKNINKEREYKEQVRFVKPTVAEVSAYCKERNNNINAEEFVAFYESKGWMIGKNPMKDWKAAVITWEINERKNPPRQSQSKRKESVYAHNLKVMDEMYGTNMYEQAYGRRQPDEQ